MITNIFRKYKTCQELSIEKMLSYATQKHVFGYQRFEKIKQAININTLSKFFIKTNFVQSIRDKKKTNILSAFCIQIITNVKGC